MTTGCSRSPETRPATSSRTKPPADEYLRRGSRALSAERALGIFIEPDVQAAVLGSGLVVDLANAVYIAYWPIVIGTLGWLLIRRPATYRLYRNALLVSGALSLAVFALFPLAPPRFLPEHGFADTIAAQSAGYRDFNASPLVNEYAAMPSLHLGWVLLVSIALVTVSRSPGVRVAAAVLPALMFAASVFTGNHYILDGIVGSVIVLASLAAATALHRRNTTPARRDRQPTVLT